MTLRDNIFAFSLISGTFALISCAMSSGKPGRLISTLNNAPLHAALASKPATPTSETAFPFPFAANSGNTSNKSSANFAVSNGFSVATRVALRIASLFE